MRADEIGAQLVTELKPNYQYRYGQWLHRRASGWSYAAPPRLAIWQAMVARKRAGVVPSTALADDIQRYLEAYFKTREKSLASTAR